MESHATQPPKVFVSHASEDKARFVIEFAKRLRDNGVDAWLDKWEMKPGDSLVDKIFEEGLKQATAVIIVLSSISVQKPWVRQELNTSVVSRISNGTKLIPVVIDDCEVPESLRSTFWQRIENLNDYDESLQSILSAIFESDERPPLGNRPTRFSGTQPKVGGLLRVDDLVLRVVARLQLDENAPIVEWDNLRTQESLRDVPIQELLDSIDILAQQGFIRVGRAIGTPVTHVFLEDFGFQKFAEAYVEDYQQVVAQIAALLVNENVRQDEELAVRVNKTCTFVNFVLNLMEANSYIKVSKYADGHSHVWDVSASLRRALQQPTAS